jgi:diguanylate cyclase (GGDEF)-like protein
LKQLIPFDTCILFTYQENDSIKAEYVFGSHSDLLQNITIDIGKGISGWVAAYRQPMVNTSAALEFQGIEDIPDLQDVISVPLIQDGSCLGTISIYINRMHFYTSHHLHLLQSIAEQATTLLHEAQIFQKSTGEALLDPVTGTFRVGYLTVAGSRSISQAIQANSTLCLVAIDIGNYSSLASLYGKENAERVLRRVADILRTELRQTDILVRFGHHGFVVLLPGVQAPQAHRYVQRLIQQIRSSPVVLGSHSLYISCHAGISTFPQDGTSLPNLLHAAQKLLSDNSKLASAHSLNPEKNILEFPPRA